MTSKEVRPRPLIILSKEAIKNPSPIVKLYGVVEKKVREERGYFKASTRILFTKNKKSTS